MTLKTKTSTTLSPEKTVAWSGVMNGKHIMFQAFVLPVVQNR